MTGPRGASGPQDDAPAPPLSARSLAAAVRAGRLSAEAVARERIEAVRRLGETLGAVNHLLENEALESARAVDAQVARGVDPGPLAGVPVAVKDNICVAGAPTTCSSRILEGYRPPYDATVVTKLRAAGAVLVAKTNMDEFAMGSSNENSAFRPALNPWDVGRVPGGSSGGSTALVASGAVPLALGSDTGGSIRQPAALCGVVGLLPTWGRVSRYGLVAFASSLDQIGPLATSVGDAALLFEAIAGPDPRDATAAAEPVPSFDEPAGSGAAELRFGVPEEYFVDGMDPEVAASVRAAIDRLRADGASVQPVSLPHTRYAIATYYIVATAEASSNLARFDGVRYGLRDAQAGTLAAMYGRTRSHGFGEEVRRRIMLGTYSLSAGYYDAFYLKAQKVRTLLRRDFEAAFRAVDVLITPTSPTPAFRLGEKSDDPLAMYLSDIFTATSNLAGVPAISLPCGLTSARLPVGLQLIGRPFGERDLLRAAGRIERLAAFGERPPVRFDSALAERAGN
jgi:aspartyl-tRNA(Asn)/glutamyl-tRNA(Gln) amidotransferase subunit A